MDLRNEMRLAGARRLQALVSCLPPEAILWCVYDRPVGADRVGPREKPTSDAGKIKAFFNQHIGRR